MDQGLAQKTTLRLIGIAGAVIFGFFFSLTYAVPDWLEDYAAGFIENKASEKINVTIDNLKPPEEGGALTRFANAVYNQNEERINQLKTSLKDNIHERMAAVLAEVRDLDCECREKYARFLKEGFEFDIALLQAANDKLVDFIQYKYMEVVSELKADVRIFTGSNTVVFLLLLLASFVKPQAMTHLFLPGTLLSVSTMICSYFYVFEQNWLLTMIYSNYLGFAYLGYLGILFLFLCDIVLNRARITTEVINAILNAIGSAASVAPC